MVCCEVGNKGLVHDHVLAYVLGGTIRLQLSRRAVLACTSLAVATQPSDYMLCRILSVRARPIPFIACLSIGCAFDSLQLGSSLELHGQRLQRGAVTWKHRLSHPDIALGTLLGTQRGVL